MRMLDKSRPFGKVSPPMDVDGCDRPAVYEQDGLLFDAHLAQCLPDSVAGRVEVAPAAKPADPKPAEDEPAMSVDALIAAANSMPYTRLLKHAKVILGPSCPGGGKQPIVDALIAAKADYEARKAKRMTASAAKPVEAADPAPAAAIVAPTPPPVAATPAPSGKPGVDLAAWGRGQKDYLFGEIQREVRIKYHAQLSERRDVVDLLIQQGVITAAQARQDV